ncbi:MAG: NAD-binding protein, partial [Litorivicinaceae bacterium]
MSSNHRGRTRIRGAAMWLLLLELRTPLITLIITYSISVLGLVLIPGMTSEGSAYHLSFLDAFYVVSYTATTIGFGETPHPFTSEQKLWMLVVMYSTVISWLYAIGSVLSVISDPAFRRLRAHQRAVSRIASQKLPFWIVCGFGGAGSQLIRFLDQSNIRCVMIDSNQARADVAKLSDLTYELNILVGDVAEPQTLVDAGVQSALCRGVLVLTDQDQVNLTVATNTRILAPRVPVYARSGTDANTRNLRSFDTEVVIDPFRVAARSVTQLIRKPCAFALYHELVDPDLNHIDVVEMPAEGHWVICADGRLADTVVEAFQRDEIPFCLVSNQAPKDKESVTWVQGLGTEARTLRAADIAHAAGILAGTNDDGDNLSILLTAQAENTQLITIARRNKPTSEPVFGHGHFTYVLREGRMIAQEMYARITTPVLHQFLGQLELMPEALVQGIIQKLHARLGDQRPELAHFDLVLDSHNAPGVLPFFHTARTPKLGDLLIDPGFGYPTMPLICLLLVRLNGDLVPFPGDGLLLAEGDRLLFWG